jgi:hypothetical protein
MATGFQTAHFGVDDRVTVRREADRDGGGAAVVVAVVGTAPDQRFTVQFPDRKKPSTFSARDLEPVKELPRGARKRGPGAGPDIEERGAPVSRRSTSAKTPRAASSTTTRAQGVPVESRPATQHPHTV